MVKIRCYLSKKPKNSCDFKMRASVVKKIVIFTILSFLLFLKLTINISYTITLEQPTQEKFLKTSIKDANLKYILLYTSSNDMPFNYMGVGQSGFTSRNCPYTNCFVTNDRFYLNDITLFDVVLFAGPDIVYQTQDFLPNERDPHQKYVFASIESSANYPVCSDRFDGYFNWSWTYKLDSIIRWGYMDVKDSENNIIGPNKIMHWMNVDEMEPLSEDLKENLREKTKAAAWFVSNCDDSSDRFEFVDYLQEELDTYDHSIDIYGLCGRLRCPPENHDKCMKMVEKDYYFYLSFENSFAEDYVTEKLLQALKIYVIPVVFGGANYTR